MRKLRIVQVVVQPVLVWDDGTELVPGPELSPLTVPLSRLAGLAGALPGEVEALAAKLAAESGNPD